ncbi:hypothetical protein [Brazilian marseillevirus]|uniref:hypothetical protein n=1 Tax=Brazilian marseillevirus TaxID=1813599 RepID=UPI00078493DC|nr:hypothetical protein A3303_gp209 [Brazilian marseillevirus]AMQ10717.1 hypothetical protein [Brazilian marseillevirus]
MHKYLCSEEDIVSFSLVIPQELDVFSTSSSLVIINEGTYVTVPDVTKEIRDVEKTFSYVKGTRVKHGPFKIRETTRVQRHGVKEDWVFISEEEGFFYRGRLQGIKTETKFSGEVGNILKRIVGTTSYKRGILHGPKTTINSKGKVRRKMLFHKGKFIKNLHS